MKNFSFFVLLMCMGCMVGPNYKRPDVAIPTQYRMKAAHDAQSELIGSWWQQFNDEQLNNLIVEAAENNLDYQVALEKICEVRAYYHIKQAELFPKVDLKASAERNRISQNLFDSQVLGPPTQSMYQIGFDASWEIDLFGKRRRDREAALYEFEAEKANARDVYITLLSEVMRHYIDIRLAQQQITKTKRQIAIYRELLLLSESLNNAGLRDTIDPLLAKASYENLESSLPHLESHLEQSIHGMAILLGKAPEAIGEKFQLIASIPTSMEEIPLGLPSDLLRRRPDIRVAEKQLAKATANVGSAIADLFPRFSLLGDFGYQSNRSRRWFNAESRSWSFGPSFDWPILYFGRIRSNIRAQTSIQKQALLSYEQTILSALKDVENSLAQYFKEGETFDHLQEELKAKERIFALKSDLYMSGLSDLQSALTAENDLIQTELQLLESQGARSTYLVTLYKALGGEW